MNELTKLEQVTKIYDCVFYLQCDMHKREGERVWKSPGKETHFGIWLLSTALPLHWLFSWLLSFLSRAFSPPNISSNHHTAAERPTRSLLHWPQETLSVQGRDECVALSNERLILFCPSCWEKPHWTPLKLWVCCGLLVCDREITSEINSWLQDDIVVKSNAFKCGFDLM